MAATQQPNNVTMQNEVLVQLASSAIDRNQFPSVRRAAATYKAPRTTLRERRAGVKPRRDCTPNSRLLTDWEE
jgi:hypothetical protein